MASYFLPEHDLMSFAKKGGRYLAENKSFPSSSNAIMIHSDEQQVKHLARLSNRQRLLVCCVAFSKTHGLSRKDVREFCKSSLGRYLGAVCVGSRVHPYYLPSDTPTDFITIGSSTVSSARQSVKYTILAMLAMGERGIIQRSSIFEHGYTRSAINTAIWRLEKEGLIRKLGTRAIALVGSGISSLDSFTES